MRRLHLPLYLRVIAGVALGAAIGLIFGKGAIIGNFTTEDLGKLGLLVIRLLKTLAVPLVVFAVLDAITRTNVSVKAGVRLLVICAANVTVAFCIGLVLMNVLHPGYAWRDHTAQIAGLSHDTIGKAPAGTSLSFLEMVSRWIPESVAHPFTENNVIALVLLAILGGAAIRQIRREAAEKNDTERTHEISTLVAAIAGGYHVLMRMLTYVVHVVPFAVFCVVAQVIGKAGLGTFSALSGFLGVILLGFALHALVYYPLVSWLIGGIHPRDFAKHGVNAVITGLSMNSSLATMPVTLQSLENMGVGPTSARLSACIGTNFNNDGITLYEAMAAVFLAQALGKDITFGAQLTIVFSALMAGIGVAGIPEAGLIVLPLVLSNAGFSDETIGALLPVVLTVDWILARCRSGVNVMADMVVAILLDRWAKRAGDVADELEPDHEAT
ncbi:MAG TPA: dicarboxylate/amino acid:cation symporter [Kofleriaceae bacterium]